MKKLLIPFFVILFGTLTQASLIEVLDLSTPEKSFKSFYSAMSDYSRGVSLDDSNLQSRIYDAIECFLPELQTQKTHEELKDHAIFIKEILDRAIAVENIKIENNQVLGTNLYFNEVGGWFYISEFSFNRAPIDYRRIQDLPYLHSNFPGAQRQPELLEYIFPNLVNSKKYFGLTSFQWLSLCLVLVLSILIYFVCLFILGFLSRIIFTQHSLYADISEALIKPITFFILAFFLKFSGVAIGLSGSYFLIWSSLVKILFSIGAFWILYCLVTPFEKALKRIAANTRSELDDHLVPLVAKTSKVILICLAFLTTIQSLGVNVFSLLAGLGVGGLAIALAAKDTAANFFGSLMILFDQPFAKGDWVRIGTLEGTIEDIGFRSTRLRTFYDSQVVIPNSTVANAEVDNMGRRQYRRTLVTLGVTYSTSQQQIQDFIKEIKKIIAQHPMTRKDTYHVVFEGFGSSSLNILLYFFIKTTDYAEELRIKEEVFTNIRLAAEKLDVSFAFPSQSLYVEKVPKNSTQEF